MKKLTINELKRVKAGALSGWAIAGIIAGVTFLVGVNPSLITGSYL